MSKNKKTELKNVNWLQGRGRILCGFVAALAIGGIIGACSVAKTIACETGETVYSTCMEEADDNLVAQEACGKALETACGKCKAWEDTLYAHCTQVAEDAVEQKACDIRNENACKAPPEGESEGNTEPVPWNPGLCTPEWVQEHGDYCGCDPNGMKCAGDGEFQCDPVSKTCQPDKDGDGEPDVPTPTEGGGGEGEGGDNETDSDAPTTGEPDPSAGTAPTTGPGEDVLCLDPNTDPCSLTYDQKEDLANGDAACASVQVDVPMVIDCSGYAKLAQGLCIDPTVDCSPLPWAGDKDDYCDDGDPGEGDFACQAFNGDDCSDCQEQGAVPNKSRTDQSPTAGQKPIDLIELISRSYTATIEHFKQAV